MDANLVTPKQAMERHRTQIIEVATPLIEEINRFLEHSWRPAESGTSVRLTRPDNVLVLPFALKHVEQTFENIGWHIKWSEELTPFGAEITPLEEALEE